MQGDITTVDGTTMSKGAKYDEWLAKQKDMPKNTDVKREDFFAKAKREREERMSGKVDVPPKTPEPPELRPQGENYRTKAMKDKLDKHLINLGLFRDVIVETYGEDKVYTEIVDKQIKKARLDLSSMESIEKKSGLPHIPMGKNTHTRSTNGFVHGKTKIKYDKKLNEDASIRLLADRIQTAWNNLPDDVRDTIDTFNIKRSRSKGYGSVQGGRYIHRKREVIVNISKWDDEEAEHNFYHEIGHSKWHNLQDKNPEKVEKFIETQKEIGTAPTKYAQSFSMKKEYYKDKIDTYIRQQKMRGIPISAKEQAVIDHNLKVSKDLYQNEIHSELNSYAMGELPVGLIKASKKDMSAMLNAYKELWDL